MVVNEGGLSILADLVSHSHAGAVQVRSSLEERQSGEGRNKGEHDDCTGSPATLSTSSLS